MISQKINLQVFGRPIMKLLLKKVVDQAIQFNWIWQVLNHTIIPFTLYAQRARTRREVIKQIPASLKPVFAKLTVMNGVFAGMKYPDMKSISSMLFPKLLGSYEKELEPLLEKLCQNHYTEIVDVGCDEGYYAVGLAMRVKSAKIFAFDTNIEALRFCKEMARLNDVAARVVTGSFCDAKTLTSLPLTERALIISDCEGYEKELFSKETLPFLARHELLIEVHDHIDVEISSYLRDLFALTHNIEIYSSIDDIKKIHQYSYKELEGLSLEQKRQMLSEGRQSLMEWFYMKPKEDNI